MIRPRGRGRGTGFGSSMMRGGGLFWFAVESEGGVDKVGGAEVEGFGWLGGFRLGGQVRFVGWLWSDGG